MADKIGFTTTVPEFAEEREMTKAAASGWERAIVAEGLLERWMLSAKQDDFVTMDVDLHARHVAHKAESLDALVADTGSFLSAEGE